MKYGKIVYNYGEAALRSSGYNLGDGIQTLALEYIYQSMGIPEEDIIEIDVCDINTYTGEYVLLPMYSVAIGIGFAKLPLSPKIIPVFISSHFAKNVFTQEEVNYIYERLKELNVDSFKERKSHIKNVNRNIKNVEKSLKRNRCPRCGGKLKKKRGR